MPDLSLSVLVTRNQLALADLEINDHLNYYIASDFLSQQTSWNRQQISSPFMDGSVTVSRNQQMVNEQITVEVLGEDTADLYSNIQALLTAFKQDDFRLKITNNGNLITYQCEAADYQTNWNGPRMVASQIQVALSVPRQPNPVVGAF